MSEDLKCPINVSYGHAVPIKWNDFTHANLKEQNRKLQGQVHQADVTEELKIRAERRASELESAIAATRDRAKEMIGRLEKER